MGSHRHMGFMEPREDTFTEIEFGFNFKIIYVKITHNSTIFALEVVPGKYKSYSGKKKQKYIINFEWIWLKYKSTGTSQNIFEAVYTVCVLIF